MTIRRRAEHLALIPRRPASTPRLRSLSLLRTMGLPRDRDGAAVPPKYPTAMIFVDESAVKVSAGRFFVVGAVKVRKPGQLLRSVQDIRDRHGYTDEFKFTKITRARMPVFSELVDVLEQSDAHIAACIVDRTRGTDPFASSDP